MTTTCLLAWAAVLLLLPIVILIWLSESPTQRQVRRCRRLHGQGWSQQRIANELSISRTTVRRRLAVA